ncbi:LacI family DNA-binding transcriptional regulator [Pleomorphovibrio marinus]|uniref:LacI family DNA-binding transcriptional regulator n=1 Tax=Pleomorphovibrio marinus TaxID=2164132 RepID=UPI000E0C28A8|nr:LacI family DNA-binding transcriptional regulator [Pleomorphovibrio marinus]
MKKEITIYDIASQIGVSPTTVSRALNNHPRVNERTKKKIYETAEELGYQSNIFASNLRRKYTYNLGVIVPRLDSPFQSSVLAGMEKMASEAGYNLIISQSLDSLSKEIANTKSMFNSRVDGLLVSLAADTGNIDHFQPFFQKEIPVLFYDRVPEQNQFTGVVIDNVQAGFEATSHLIDQGCENIVHVLGNPKINVYMDRLKGYKYALMDHDKHYNPDYVIHLKLDEHAGENIVEQLLNMDPVPDGLLVSNDTCAASCVIALKKRGIEIPRQMAIVGFNNDLISRMVDPNLSTINYPSFHMGEVAVKNLINHLSDEENQLLQKTETITLRFSLIVRGSSNRLAL